MKKLQYSVALVFADAAEPEEKSPVHSSYIMKHPASDK